MFANRAAPPKRAPMATPAVGNCAALVPVSVGSMLVTSLEMELTLLSTELLIELMAELELPAAEVTSELALEIADEAEEPMAEVAELNADPAVVLMGPSPLASPLVVVATWA